MPRFLFVDFPLGNPCGKPWDTSMQDRILNEALTLLESAFQSRTTVQSAEVWDASGEDPWRDRFMAVPDEILAATQEPSSDNRANP